MQIAGACFVRSKKEVNGCIWPGSLGSHTWQGFFATIEVYSLHRYLLCAFILIYFGAEVLVSMWAVKLVPLRL